jgi:succinate dehydrogenase / fumarate reductase flavoprotein subunit
MWVDYNLMSTIPGLFIIGEANFSDHGANRLGASALMQGLADGYFIVPLTMGNYLAQAKLDAVETNHEAFREAEEGIKNRINTLLNIDGKRSADSFHRELGKVMWEYCGMGRTAAGLKTALEKIPEIKAEFWENVKIPGNNDQLNQNLELAGRVADFIELGELICIDALHRNESAGGHYREEYQTEEGEARRDDENFAYVAAWQYNGDGNEPILNKESLKFEYVKLSQRSYK